MTKEQFLLHDIIGTTLDGSPFETSLFLNNSLLRNTIIADIDDQLFDNVETLLCEFSIDFIESRDVETTVIISVERTLIVEQWTEHSLNHECVRGPSSSLPLPDVNVKLTYEELCSAFEVSPFLSIEAYLFILSEKYRWSSSCWNVSVTFDLSY